MTRDRDRREATGTAPRGYWWHFPFRPETSNRMKTTRFFALFISLLAPLATASAAAMRPNIVFILADDWGWGDLSCHGHAWLKTPHLDRLADAGTDFQRFNVLNPVCSPSRTAVMTGR